MASDVQRNVPGYRNVYKLIFKKKEEGKWKKRTSNGLN